MKILRAVHSSEDERDAFLREARVLGQLSHKYILEILDAGFDAQGEPFLISRFASGGSLAARLQQQAGRPLPFALALKVLNQVGEALIYAHQRNVIHRDLKPANILFNEADDAVLSDFGLATTLSTGSIKHTSPIGTAVYMAPEQFIGVVSKETDQYALGCLAYELLTGHRVFDASSHFALANLHTNQEPVPPSHYNPDLPAFVEQAILRALAKQRERRHPGVEAFLRALNDAPDGEDDVPPTLPSLMFPTPVQQPEGKGTRPAPAPVERKTEPPATPPPILVAPARKVQDQAFEPLNLSNVLIQPEAQQKKLEDLAQAARQEPNDAGRHVKYGRALYNLQRYEEALKAFQRAVDLQSRHGGYLHWMGMALYQLKRYDAALVAFSKAVQAEPQSPEHVRMQHEVLSAQQQASLAFKEAAKPAPKPANAQPTPPTPKAQPAQTRADVAEKRQPAAPAKTSQAPQKQPEQPKQKARSTPQPSAGSAGKAQVQAKAAEAKPQNQAQAARSAPAVSNGAAAADLYQRGMALYNDEAYTLALTNFERAVFLVPHNGTYHIARGRALAGLRYYAQALAAFDEAIRLSPNNEEAPRRKAEVLKIQREHARPAPKASAAQQPKKKRKKKKEPVQPPLNTYREYKTPPPGASTTPVLKQENPLQRFLKRFLP